MSDHIKSVISRYRDKRELMKRSEFVTFRVTPEERDLLYQVYGSPVGIRDFALASTDADITGDDYEYRMDDLKVDEDDEQR